MPSASWNANCIDRTNLIAMHRDRSPNKPHPPAASSRNIWHATNYGSFIKVVLAIGAIALPFALWIMLG